MRKITHINIGYTPLLWSISLGIFSPIFILGPFLFILADADHGRDSLSSKGLTLPGKHRGWSHSIFGASILTFFVGLIYMFIVYISSGISSIHSDITIIVYTMLGLITVSLIISIFTSLLFKLLNIKFIKNILAGLILIGYVIGLLLISTGYFQLSFGFKPDIVIMIINIFILSHIIGDYFTKSGVPIFFPFSQERYRIPILYVSTGTVGENIVNLAFVFINLILIFYLYQEGKFKLIIDQYKTSIVGLNDKIVNIGLLVISWLVILYFLGKDINASQLKKNSKEIISSSLRILGYVTVIFIILMGLLLGRDYINGLAGQFSNIITIISAIIFLFTIYLFGKKILKEITDVSISIVYVMVILIQLYISLVVLYSIYV